MSTKIEKLRVPAVVACLLALVVLILGLARPSLLPRHVLGTARIQPIELVGLAWAVFGCAAWLARKAAVKVVTGLILAGGIALQVAALAGPPQNSSDLYRYIWDGRVQVAGIDPYLYAPGDAGVARLRNDFLWVSASDKHGPYDVCAPESRDSADPSASLVAGCTKINRPQVPTVYPPVAEAYFTGVQLIAPADDSTTPVQAGAALFAVVTTVILLFGLRRTGKDPRLAALWAWCPTVALEAGQNGHVDVVGVALTAVALLLLAEAQTRKRKIAGGVLLGLAIATKVTPVLALPGVLRRGWHLICASAASAIVIVYVPHVIAVGSKIIGFFPGYLHQEGYSSGTGFSVIGLFVPGKAALAVAVVILGLVALAILRYGDPHTPWRGGVLMTSAALAVCTPDYQWYAILLVMLVALDGQPEWLLIAAGGYLSNSPGLYIHGFTLHDPRLAGYGGGAAAACALALLRLALRRRKPPEAEPPETEPSEAESPEAEPAGETAEEAAVEEAPAAPAIEAAAEPEAEPVIEPTAVMGPNALIGHSSVIIGPGGRPGFEFDE